MLVVLVVLANIPGDRGTGRSCAHDGYAPGIKATFRSPPAFTGPRCTRDEHRADDDDGSLLVLLLPAVRLAPVHCSPARFGWVYRDHYYWTTIPRRVIRMRCAIMYWLPPKERRNASFTLCEPIICCVLYIQISRNYISLAFFLVSKNHLRKTWHLIRNLKLRI